MQGNVEKHGRYELFETTNGHQILNLNDKDFYAVVEGQRGDLLVRSDSDHKKKKTVQEGEFYLANFDDDPEFNDTPHLFLQDGKNAYREWILPRDLPTGSDHQRKLVRTENRVGKDKVKFHTEGSGNKGREKQYKGTSKEAKSRDAAAGKSTSASGTSSQSLKAKTKQELYDIAKRRNLDGRSKMSKDQLVNALAAH